MDKKYFLLFLLNSFFYTIIAQDYNLGVPMIQSFSKEDFKGGAQNWDIKQDRFGVMYFANNNGLLVFDGTTWNTHNLPNYTIVRSLGITSKGIIYVGGQNEFGRFTPDEKGILRFESLKHLIPQKHQNFTDVWKIELYEDGVLFNSDFKIFHLKNETIKVFDQGTFKNLGNTGNQIFASDTKSGIYFLKGDNLEKLKGSAFFKNKTVQAVIKNEPGFLIATLKNGIFQYSNGKVEPWKTDYDQFIKENNIQGATAIAGERYAIATAYGGLLVLDKSGKIINTLHKGNGLLSNNLLTMYYDRSNNLWLGLSNGINYIHTNSPFHRIYPDSDLDAVGYNTKIHQGKIYFATNEGVFVNDWKKYYSPSESTNHRFIPSTRGQIWGMDIVNNQLFAGHAEGAFLIENENASKILNERGFWTFEAYNGSKNKILAGTYFEVSLLESENAQVFSENPIAQINESCRFVEQDNRGNIWVAHPYRGILKIKPSQTGESEIKLMGSNEGLPSHNLNHLFKIKDEIIFCGERGVFIFDYDEEKFVPHEAFNQLFGKETKVRRLQETPDGNIWFITTTELGLLKISDRGLEKEVNKIVFPYPVQQLNLGHESIYPYDEENVFITNDRGFIHYNTSKFIESDSIFNVILNEVKITSNKDSIISNGFYYANDQVEIQQPQNQIPTFDHFLNDLHFKFSATDYVSGSGNSYRYFLKGYEEDWSTWHAENTKEYTNLSPGKYTFHLQAKSNSQNESNILTYQFVITPPWYASKFAYGIYGILTLLGLASVIKFYSKKYSGLKEDHDLVVKESKETIGKLQAEKIEAELAYKQRELVSTTLSLVKKNDTLVNIKERLQEIKKTVSEKETVKQLEKLIKKLHIEEIQDENWEQVMFHFNQLHKGFFDRLKEEYPSLTPKDLKMCAYLRMNLSTKEMTSLMNVTTRGVEASRYRLRKKFGLVKEQNLTEFLMGF